MGLGLLLGTKRPKLAAYIKGESDDINAAMLQFAQEFASVPDPNTGRSFYADKGNKTKHTVAETREALERAREAYASGIISEVIPREGEISNTQIIDTASQAIEQGTEPAPLLNITQSPGWNEEQASRFNSKMQEAGLDIKPEDVIYFATQEEAKAAKDAGRIKTGDRILIGSKYMKVE